MMKKLSAWFKLIWNAKWGNKWSAIFIGAYWILTDYISLEGMLFYFDHKHEYYNASAGSGVVLECNKCGWFK